MCFLMTRENLTGVRVIRAFNKEKDELKRFEEGNQILTDAQEVRGAYLGTYESSDILWSSTEQRLF